MSEYKKIEDELGLVVERIQKFEKKYSPSTMPSPAYEIQSVLYNHINDILTITRDKKVESWTLDDGKFIVNSEKKNKLEKKFLK